MNVLFILFFIFYTFFKPVYSQQVFALNKTTRVEQGPATVTGRVPGCGDGVIETNELCDRNNLGNHTCVSLGFIGGGALACNQFCYFDVSKCIIAPPAPPPAPPGGGGGVPIMPVETGVILSGRAFPSTRVFVLQDAQIVTSVLADSAANFNISVLNLTTGNYIFSVYSEDTDGRRSSLLTFPVTITTGVIIRIGNIFIAPTIAVNKSDVRRGNNIAIFGQSIPNANITIQVASEELFFARTVADRDGVFLYNFDTSPLYIGRHFAKSKAARDGRISSFSQAVGFNVGLRNVFLDQRRRILRGDLNNDGRVNIIDFSIAAFWHRRTTTPAFQIIERERLNGDRIINLIDFSIMAFYWTG